MSLLVRHILRIYYGTKSTASNDHCSVLVFIFSLSSLTIIVQATVLQLHLGNDYFKTEQESRLFFLSFFLLFFQISFFVSLIFHEEYCSLQEMSIQEQPFHPSMMNRHNRNLSGIQTEPLGYIIIMKPDSKINWCVNKLSVKKEKKRKKREEYISISSEAGTFPFKKSL